ncbi:MAG: sulfatase-like hydrolase/transferase [Candidatus Hydrogenedentota bacterium]
MEHQTEIHSSRRTFLKTQAAAAAAIALGRTAQGQGTSRRKPNLLFLWTDEQRPDTMAAYGNHVIQTPNLNRLASESVVFRNAYVSQPVCTPSRSTVMTGLWPHMNGCTENNIALPQDVPTFPELVADPDYATGYFGKWHLGDEVFAQHGFQEWRSIEDGYRRYYREERDMTKKSDYWHFLCEQGYEPPGERGNFSRTFATNRPYEHTKPRFLEREACDFLRRHRDEPFMLYINFLEPHMPFTGPFDDLHALDDVYAPKNFDDPLEDNEPEEYRKRRAYYLENGWKDLPLKTEANWRRLIANYWGLVHSVDRAVGGILRTLEDLGLMDNTIIVYTSDHGDMMGSHRLLTKCYSYEESERVPWLMRIPDIPGRQITAPVSHIDLVPTLLDLMDAKADAPLPGKSLVPCIRDGRDPGPVIVEWHRAGTIDKSGPNPAGAIRLPDLPEGNAFRTIVTPDRWKLTLHTLEHNQLYNLNDDPGETTNLFGRPEHEERVRTMTAAIHAWQEKVKDPIEVEL